MGPAEIRPLPLMPLRRDTLARAAPWEDSNSFLVAPQQCQGAQGALGMQLSVGEP